MSAPKALGIKLHGSFAPAVTAEHQQAAASSSSSSSARISASEFADRAAGAIVGSFIGDALSLPCHWYYDLDVMRQQCNGLVNDYMDFPNDRYHAGTPKGHWSSSAQQEFIMLQSLAATKEHYYHQQDFCDRFDVMLNELDIAAFPNTGKGQYVDRQVREVCVARRQHHQEWTDELLKTHTDTTEGSHRCIPLIARYAADESLALSSQHAYQNISLTYGDASTISAQCSYGFLLASLIQGHSFVYAQLKSIVGKTMKGLPGTTDNYKINFDLPFSDDKTLRKRIGVSVNNPDAALLALWVTNAVEKKIVDLKDHALCSQVYGSSCAAPYIFSTTYYLANVFRNDFESGIFASVNAGGQNVARSAHVGALLGAQVGLSKIPQRLIDGLERNAEIVEMAKLIGQRAAEDWKQ